MNYSAQQLSRAGDRYLGRSYGEMDCQAFVERCLADIGCRLDLKGSNAWYRKCLQEGWAGTPEDCVRLFGSVPAGAFLFILSPDGGEAARGYRDGLGNATHMGLKTGRGKGAVHSSQSRGCVCESEFRDRTVRGGWNMVGLWNRLDYGNPFSWHLRHGGPEEMENSIKEEKTVVVVTSPNGAPVNLRKSASRSAQLVERIPPGTPAERLEQGPEWSKLRVGGKTGWMMSEFLVTEEGAGTAENPSGTYSVTISGLDLTQAQAICNNYPGRSTMEVSRG